MAFNAAVRGKMNLKAGQCIFARVFQTEYFIFDLSKKDTDREVKPMVIYVRLSNQGLLVQCSLNDSVNTFSSSHMNHI